MSHKKAQAPARDSKAELAQALALHQAGRLDEAEAIYHRMLAADPKNVSALNLLGAAAHQRRNLNQALEWMSKAVALAPQVAMLHGNLGAVLGDLDRNEDAVATLTRAIQLDPKLADAHYNLANVLQKLGRGDEAAAAYAKAFEVNPGHAMSCYNLANMLVGQGRFNEAEEWFRRSIAAKADFLDPLVNFGELLSSRGKLTESVSMYERALALNPNSTESLNNLGCILNDMGRPAEAKDYFLRALAIDPHMSRAYSNLMMSLHYMPGITNADMLEAAKKYVQHVPVTGDGGDFANSRDPGRPLRIGYVSGDFYTHPIGHLLTSVLEANDPSRFQIFCYSNNAYTDGVTARMQAAVQGWRSIVNVSDADAARMIREDGIDILVDLSGHTAKNRLALFARRPAPVQASWIGYFGTTGVPQIDYILMDPVAVRPEEDRWYTEQVVRLPHGRFCYTPPAYAPDVAEPPCLKNGYVTFGSFNNLNKLKPDVIRLWSQLLQAMPSAKLRLKWKSLGDEGTRQTVLRNFAAFSIGPERLELRGATPHAEMLAEYGEVDIALDPFPYCGGLTSCEALWMGVPVVTLPGEFPVSRQTQGFLQLLGMGDLVAFSPEDYIAHAVRLANDPARMVELRRAQRERMRASPMVDAKIFTPELEKAYRAMWATWCREGTPASAPVAGPERGLLLQLQRDGSLVAPQPMALANPKIRLVCATRANAEDFLANGALGRSLPLFRFNPGMELLLFAGNTRGLPEIYNIAIEDAKDDPAILVFIHDDLHVVDFLWMVKLQEALKTFPVVGLAGNRRRLKGQTTWAFVDDKFTWDDPANLSGCVGHGKGFPCQLVSYFGPRRVECKLLDGLFLAAESKVLHAKGLRFDPRFAFHFYDLDFCRQAEKLGLKMGTWDIDVVHESGGGYGSPSWQAGRAAYLEKYGE